MIQLTLGKYIKELGLTQTDVARLTGLSRQTISKLVNQPAQIKLDSIERLCDKLDLSPGQLFRRVKITDWE